MSAPDRRRRELAAIHAGRRQLGWDEDTYRATLLQLTGCSSAGDLDERGRAVVLDTMRELGYARSAGAPPQMRPQVALAQELWRRLDSAGALRDGSDGALQKFAKRVTGVARLEWCRPDDMSKVIEGLKAWVARAESATQRGKDG